VKSWSNETINARVNLKHKIGDKMDFLQEIKSCEAILLMGKGLDTSLLA
jgi:hypothetical protein